MTSVIRRTSALIHACMQASYIYIYIYIYIYTYIYIYIYRRYQLQESNFSVEIHSKLSHLNTDTLCLDN